jgi:hypothetical protein
MKAKKKDFSIIFPEEREVVKGHPVEALVYYSLIRYHNQVSGYCYPSYNRLVEDTGYSRRTIIRTIKRLEGMGLVVKHIRSKKDRPNIDQTNLYILQLRNNLLKEYKEAKE